MTKDNQVQQANCYRPHCFPDLSMGGFEPKAPQTDEALSFQQVGNPAGQGSSGGFLVGAVSENGSVTASGMDVAEIRKEAYAEGYAEGEKAGQQSSSRQLTPVINNFSQAVEELEKIKKNIFLNAEKKTLNLALAVARKIVIREIESNREVIFDIIREALDSIVDREGITIRVNPEDYRHVTQSNGRLSEMIDDYEHITFEEDSTISGGGCLIKTRMGDIDARVDRQFKVIEELFESQFQMMKKEAE